jgi:hypothetical protein
VGRQPEVGVEDGAHHFEGVSGEVVTPAPVSRLVRRDPPPFVVGVQEGYVVAG